MPRSSSPKRQTYMIRWEEVEGQPFLVFAHLTRREMGHIAQMLEEAGKVNFLGMEPVDTTPETYGVLREEIRQRYYGR